MASDEGKDWFETQLDEELSLCVKHALLETEKWIWALTGKTFKNADDPRKSLEDGVLLCELLNGLRPGTIGKINRLPTPIAGIDNLNVFLQCCNKHFGLKDSQLFAPGDLEDLSNRAFADSEDQLRVEAERRIRNVLITVFWLGRKAQDCFNGPQLEFSAFAPLLGNQGYLPSNFQPVQRCLSPASSVASSARGISDTTSDLPEERFGARAADIILQRSEAQHSITSEEILSESQHRRQVSSDSIDHSSAYGSFLSGPKTSLSSDFVDDGASHSRNDSYDSLLSDGQGHVDFSTVDTYQPAMPVRHKSSPGSNKEFRYSATFDGVYDQRDSMDMEYGGSTGSLSQSGSVDGYNRFRLSDSAPHNTSQGSIDSGGPKSPKAFSSSDVALATRAAERKASAPATDPLQFIKGNIKNPLAEKAKITVDAMQKQKEQKKIAQIEDADWQSNLSNWKSKMRRKSAVEYRKVTVFEEVEKQLEEENQANKKKNKTFKEMMEERQQRKSGITSSYPMDDDDSVFKTSPRTQQKDQETLQTLKGYSEAPLSTFNHEEKENFQFSKSVDTGLNRVSDVSEKRYGVTRQYTEPEEEVRKVRPLDRLKTRSSHSPDNRWSWHADKFGQGDSSTPWGDSVQKDNNKRETSPLRPSPGKLANLSRFEPPKESKTFRDASPLRDTQEGKEQAARFQNKLKMFEAKKDEAHTSVVSSRVTTDTPASPTRRLGNITAPPAPSAALSQSKPIGAYSSIFASKTNAASGKLDALTSSTYQQKSSASATETTYQKYSPRSAISNQESNSDTREHGLPSWKEKLKDASDKRSPFAEVSKTSVSSEESRNVIEKTIKITQNPGSNKGFGFHIKGGRENGLPITVQKVSLGSAADVCELQAGDEVVSVNGAEVASHYLESVKLVLSQAARIGQVELVIKRSISQDPLLEDSFEQEEQLRLSHSQRLLAAQRHPSMSPTPERNEESGQERFEEPQRDVGLHPQVEEADHRSESPASSESLVDSEEERRIQARIDEQERDRRIQARLEEEERQRQIQARLEEEERQRQIQARLEEEERQRQIQARLEEEERQRQIQARLEEEERQRQIQARLEEEERQRQIQARLDEEERERLDKLYGHTFEQSPKSWEPPVEPVYDGFEPEASRETAAPPVLGHQPPPFQQQAPCPGQYDNEEEDDAPPPLPAAPPPAPNWNTFPGQAPTNSDMSFFDASDLLPDTSMTPVREESLEDRPVRMERSGSMDDLDEVTQKKLETVRRRSAFLGLNVYQTEEYKKIKEEAAKDKQNRKKEEDTWQKIERQETLRPVSDILSDFREPTKTAEPVPTWGTVESPNKDSDDTGFNSFGTGESKYSDGIDLETQEEEIIANLEREERERRARDTAPPDAGGHASTPEWHTHRFEPHEVDIEAGREPESVRLNTKPEDRLSRKYFNQEEEMRRMQLWQEEQERLRQEKYEREQKVLRQQHEEDMKRVRQIEEDKRRQEESLLEKERQWQQQMEEKKRKLEEERQRFEEERILMAKENEERKQNEQIQRDAGYQSRFPWQSLANEVDKDRIRREEDDILAERDRERDRREEERRKREEKEAELMKEKEEELKAMEDRIAREAEQLRIERDRLKAEKEEQRKRWNLQSEGVPRAMPQGSSSQPKYTPAQGGGITQVVTTTMAPVQQKGQFEYVYRAEHSPPEKLKRDFVPKVENISRENVAVSRESVPVARENKSAPPETKPAPQGRIVSIERKEETLVSRSPFGSTTSLNDPLKRGTPLGGRKAFPIQPKPNIKEELLNKPPSPIPSLRGSTPVLSKPNPPPSPTTRVSDGAAIQLDRRSLHQLNQVPRPRLNENWVNPDAGKKSSAARRSEVMRQTSPSAQHWVVEEAERRRLAEQSGKERLQKLQSRQQQQGLVQNTDGNSRQTNYYSHSGNAMTMEPSSEAEPYIAALRQAGVYASAGTSGSQQSLHSLREPATTSYTYPRGNQPKYPSGLYSDETGYPAGFQQPTSPEIKTGYPGGTANARPARPIPEAIKQTLLERVNSPKSVRYNGGAQLSQSMPHPASSQSAPPQSLSQSHHFHPSHHGPSSPAYAYPHQVKTLSSPYQANQPYVSANQSVIGPTQQYSNSNQPYGIPNQPVSSTSQPYNNSNQPYSGSTNNPLHNSSQAYGSGPPYSSFNGSYGNQAQFYSQYNSAPAKPPRTFENDMQLASDRQYNPYPTPYGSSPNANVFYSPKSSQPPNPKHLSPNERSASDSSESAPPIPPKSAQLLQQPQEEAIAEQIVSVAGHQRCAHCETELGQGAAMIIESLQLYYHVHCFRCCVCCAPLGTGERGADVRVRLNKLHCQNCYSNDEAGLKYSRV